MMYTNWESSKKCSNRTTYDDWIYECIFIYEAS